MATRRVKQPSLFLRSGYFIDSLREQTGFSAEKLDQRIRNNQYLRLQLIPPAEETVRDYFRLYRSVAFEPYGKDGIGPWLLAAELEFPGCSKAFFHPLFDLLLGHVESQAYWAARFQHIPDDWIEDAARRGDTELAERWRQSNIQLSGKISRRTSRKRDRLTATHLCLLRLSDNAPAFLFERNGLAASWSRRYRPLEEELGFMTRSETINTLAGLMGLLLEADEIGDRRRIDAFRQAVSGRLATLEKLPACKRIGKRLKVLLESFVQQDFSGHCYSTSVIALDGLPARWSAMAAQAMLHGECVAK